MAKDPAFLFYPGDFTTGTQFFTDEQVGKYIRLLLAQHQTGHLHEKHMLQICKTHDKDVFDKFRQDENGLYYNERLENEIIKRKEYSKSRSENRKKKNISSSHDIDMENKNKDSNYSNSLTNGNGAWSTEKMLFLNAEQWQYKQSSEYKISKNALLEYINVFLNRIELQEDYKSESELKKHCANWLRKNISVDKTKALEEKRILPENYFTDV
jgi:uncharacterized protein YdaU (DUF1376 family)